MSQDLLSHRVQGDGAHAVVLVHGVGVDAGAFSTVAERLARHLTVVTVDRRGYGGSRLRTPAGSLAEQVDDLRRLVDVFAESSAGRPSVVGVSGGATLALALAIDECQHTFDPILLDSTNDTGTVVVHEPLLGPLAPTLHHQVVDSYEHSLAHDPSLAVRYIAGLVGADTWAALDEAARARVERAGAVIAAEVPTFLAYAPTTDDLRRLRSVDLVTSVGANSSQARWEASCVLRETAAARPLVVPGAGHLPQVDAPEAFADALLDLVSWKEIPA